MVSAGTVAAIVILGVALSIVSSLYVVSSSNVSSLSSTVTADQSQITYLQEHPSTTTLTIVSTSTSTTTYTTTSSTTVYPVPENVTVLLVSNIDINYAITASALSYGGSTSGNNSIPITPVFRGEAISVTASLDYQAVAGCEPYQYAIVSLYVNGTIVSQAKAVCGGNTNAQIAYVL